MRYVGESVGRTFDGSDMFAEQSGVCELPLATEKQRRRSTARVAKGQANRHGQEYLACSQATIATAASASNEESGIEALNY